MPQSCRSQQNRCHTLISISTVTKVIYTDLDVHRVFNSKLISMRPVDSMQSSYLTLFVPAIHISTVTNFALNVPQRRHQMAPRAADVRAVDPVVIDRYGVFLQSRGVLFSPSFRVYKCDGKLLVIDGKCKNMYQILHLMIPAAGDEHHLARVLDQFNFFDIIVQFRITNVEWQVSTRVSQFVFFPCSE